MVLHSNVLLKLTNPLGSEKRSRESTNYLLAFLNAHRNRFMSWLPHSLLSIPRTTFTLPKLGARTSERTPLPSPSAGIPDPYSPPSLALTELWGVRFIKVHIIYGYIYVCMYECSSIHIYSFGAWDILSRRSSGKRMRVKGLRVCGFDFWSSGVWGLLDFWFRAWAF